MIDDREVADVHDLLASWDPATSPGQLRFQLRCALEELADRTATALRDQTREESKRLE